MPNWIVVAFYTINTPYEEEVKGLKKTCDGHGIHCHIKGYPNLHNWTRNAGIKPRFLLEMMELHPTKKIVYLDADARIRKYPTRFDSMRADIGIHYRDRGNGRKELLSGTILISPTHRAKTLIEHWAKVQLENPDTWDQRTLERLLNRWNYPLTLEELPATYCQIFDSMKDAGNPVIEHLQASRRFKKLVEHGIQTTPIPSSISGCRIRVSPSDGSYWITRRHKKAEAFLDQHCIRIPGTRRWRPKFVSDKRFENLRPLFNKRPCYIVGKGPSLDHLRVEHFEDYYPIIALNEAIHVIEAMPTLTNPRYCLQQDAKLRATCKPKAAPIFVSTKAANYYATESNAYLFQNTALGLSPNALSVSAAIELAKRLGTSEFRLVCFDACINGKLHYAKAIGYESTFGGAPERFKSHRSKILRRAGQIPIQWIIPEAPA